jgi:peptide deformylase
MPKLLKFIEKMHPLLRETMPEEENFKDPALQQIIEDMCYSIQPAQLKEAEGAHDSAAGMAANQWGLKKRIFIYTPEGSELGKRMEVMLNPSYVPYLRLGETEPKMVAAYEGCFSIPLTVGVVNRYDAIEATYYTPEGEKMVRVLEGWEARVFQHETDHLNGRLFDGVLDNYQGPECLERYIFKDAKEMEDFYEGKVKTSRTKKT